VRSPASFPALRVCLKQGQAFSLFQTWLKVCLSPFHSTRLLPNRVAFGDFMLLQRAILANREFTHSVFDALLAPD
jgi:hypothetical protein